MFQANPDTGIHLTLGTGVATILAKMIWDGFRKNGNGGNEKLLREMRDDIRELLTIVKLKNNL